MQKIFEQGMTKADKAAVAEGVKHFNSEPHNKTICPACQIKQDFLDWTVNDRH